MVGHFTKNNPGALGELQQNQQGAAPRSPQKSAKSPTKSTFGKLPFRTHGRDRDRDTTSGDASPQKPKKTKSSTNLAGLLSRPKSLRNLYGKAADDETRAKDKENRTPQSQPTPIFAQFTSDQPNVTQQKQRPQSQIVSASPTKRNFSTPRNGTVDAHTPQLKTRTGFGHARSKSVITSPSGAELPELHIDPKDINEQLEALLDRRNIPHNQRHKMRSLADSIKLEFIRQDYAEMQAARLLATTGSASSLEAASGNASSPDYNDEERRPRSRGRNFTFSRKKSDSASPVKKSKGEGTLGRHFRSRSTDSIASERPSSSSSSTGVGFFSKMKAQQSPSDYVSYLRKAQKPELVEVGKLHKLRLLLRNETVAWIEDFIDQGGLEEIVGLLNRIMEVEWREEHEDALLHENLLCLKGLATTARAMAYLHRVQGELFPRLLHLLFDPEKKGPSEFTTRNIVTSVLLAYVQSAAPEERLERAQNLLKHLRNQQEEDSKRPLPFVLEMRQERPYTVWCKEVVSVTKEVFWIFLHNVNVVTLPNKKDAASLRSSDNTGPYGYMVRHFPQERPPVAAAPYVGGVEWDATNYLASHLDLLNAIIACTPTRDQRNKLRAEFRISGWERCLGGSLRLCKEKFYGSVHIALRTWVAAAAEDEWDVRDVRFGPAPDAKASPKKNGAPKAPVEPPPKLEMPKLDFGNDKPKSGVDAWL